MEETLKKAVNPIVHSLIYGFLGDLHNHVVVLQKTAEMS
jgi:hypothetical protein